MKIKKLLKDIEKRSKEIEDKHPESKFLDIEHFKSVKDKEAYHITIQFELTYDKDILAEIFSKKADDVASIKPNIGFDFDLDYYTDEHVYYTLDEVFNQYISWLNTLEDSYKSYSRTHKDSKISNYLR